MLQFARRQQFLRSFVRSIVWTDPEVTVEYTLPVPPSTVELGQTDVFHIVTGGGPSWIRTTDLSLIRTAL